MQQHCQNPNRRKVARAAGGRPPARSGAFTLIEVLVVIAIITVLAALMLPALDKAKTRGHQIACLNHLKQLAVCWHLYAADHHGRLVENLPATHGTNSWVTGNLKLAAEATNLALLKHGKLFPYASQTAIYRCPADPAHTQGAPHIRSYAMNSWVGSRHMENLSRKGFRTFVRDSETAAAGAGTLWLMMDEHEASLDDGWFLVTMDDSRPFASFPATRHQHGAGVNFADGHAELFKLRETRTPPGGAHVSASNTDWLRLKQITTTR